MPDNDKPVRVRLYVETGFPGDTHTDAIEIDRAKWDDMTPTERCALLDGKALTLLYDSGLTVSWEFADETDRSQVAG